MQKPNALIVLFLALFSLAGSVLADPVDDCIKGEGDDQIAACSQIISSKIHRGKPITMDNLPAIYVYRGTAFGKRGDYKKALADFSMAIKLDPKLTMAWGDRGAFYNRYSRFELAIKDFEQATRLDPSFDEGFAGLGYAWFRLGYEDKAITAYTKAIKLAPDFPDYYYARASVYMEEFYAEGKFSKGNRQKLLADLHKVLQLDPTHKGALADMKTIGAH